VLAFQRENIARHSCPNKILTRFKRVCEQYRIHHLVSSAYHHQTIGRVERFHKFMENSLSTVIKKNQSDWPKYVESCLFVYRTTFNRALNEIPFFLMYRRDPVMPRDLLIPISERQTRVVRTEDLDIYKNNYCKYFATLTSQSLDRFKQEYQNKYKC
jgi:hypothetical protein